MKHIIIVLLVLLSKQATCQTWYSAKDTLKLPKSPGNIYSSIGSINKYDTIPIKYTVKSVYCGTLDFTNNGYKPVYVHHGFYCDDSTTYGVILNSKKEPICDVEYYSFILKKRKK